MANFRILVALSVLALALLIPTSAWAQPPIMRVYGDAAKDGVTVPNGTQVAAFIEGAQVATATTSGGSYVMDIIQPSGANYSGKTVSFTVGGLPAAQTTTWSAGAFKSLSLNGSSIVPVETAFRSIAGKYTTVWSFDAPTQTWKLYAPTTPAISDLTGLVRGMGYWVYITEAVTLLYGGGIYDLAAGWNLIGWLG